MNRKEPTSINKTVNFMMLPNDLVVDCLARVSIMYYPTLSLVSKSFRSLIASPELYETRTLLGRTESVLYVCLSSCVHSRLGWFVLCRRPKPQPKPKQGWYSPSLLTNNHTSENTIDNLLIPILSIDSSSLSTYSKFVAVGSNIYHIGRDTTKFSFLDCRSHTWHEAPKMLSANLLPLVSVLDGKIYVAKHYHSRNCIQIFDPKTQIWEYLQSPAGACYMNISFAIEGKLYLQREMDQSLVYNLKENRWDEEELEMSLDFHRSVACVIDDVFYCLTYGKLQWYGL